MRGLERNKTTFYYATVTGETDVVDDDGLYTGETTITYSTPVEIRGHVSPASGSVMAEVFGLDSAYSKAIVIDDPDCPIDETSVLWINTPATDSGGVLPYNYVVRRKAVSRNYVVYAVEEVTRG